ncbi:MAG TPA: glycosyltransferase [Vicinamibacterales bacterium]|nr:glycosyltransferase [Vicinamibacterales bacterium]
MSRQGGGRLRVVVFTAEVPWGMSESFVLSELVELERRVEALLVIPVRPATPLFHGAEARSVAEFALCVPLLSVRVIVGAIGVTLGSPARVARVTLELVRASRSWWILLKNVAVLPKALYATRLVRAFGAGHIHAHWASVPASMAFIVSRLTGIPWSVTAHRFDIAEDNLLRVKIQSARFARVISSRGRREVLRIIGEPDQPNLVELHVGTHIPPIPLDVHPSDGRPPVVVCVANLVAIKGHRYLVDACRILRERGVSFSCQIIGAGPLRSAIERQVRDLGLDACVRVRGPVLHDEVMAMLREGECDVAVLPSIRMANGAEEGIPVALMEALAHRVPAVATETGGIPELLGDGAGVLVKPASSIDLANALERLLADPVGRAALAGTGRRRIERDFNGAMIADRLVALMEPDAAVRSWTQG